MECNKLYLMSDMISINNKEKRSQLISVYRGIKYYNYQ